MKLQDLFTPEEFAEEFCRTGTFEEGVQEVAESHPRLEAYYFALRKRMEEVGFTVLLPDEIPITMTTLTHVDLILRRKATH